MPTADERFCAVVRENPSAMRAAQDAARAAMVERDCLFDGVPLPHFLKPYFLSPRQTALLSRQATCLIAILEKITKLYFSHPELRAAFHLSREASQLIAIDPGYARNIVICRPDAFLDGERLHFIEFNCDSPAGAMYTDLEEDIFVEAYPMRDLAREFLWKRVSRRRAALDALLECYAEFGGRESAPCIAIVDWRDVKTLHEFELLRAYFESEGYPTVIADPRDLNYRNGELYAGKRRADIIYRRVIFHELLERLGDVQDFLRAYAERAVCVANPLRSRLAANKSMLSLLTNPAYDHLFTDEENASKADFIPWTRKVDDAERFYGGRKALVLDLVLDHREQMVLKPAEGYGGRDVHIGRETDPREWEALARRVVESGTDWVVQEYVDIPQTLVPVEDGSGVRLVAKKVNINPYVFGGRYAGCIARLSDNSVINVSAGGGLVPALSYEPLDGNGA